MTKTKKMQVTLLAQIELDYDETADEEYQEKLELLVEELEELGLKVDVEAEEPVTDEEEY